MARAGVTQFRWDYVNFADSGERCEGTSFMLLGVNLPLEGLGVLGLQETVAGYAGHGLLTSFPFKVRRYRGEGQWSVGAKRVCDGLAPAQSLCEGWH